MRTTKQKPTPTVSCPPIGDEVELGERDAKKLFFAIFDNTVRNRKTFDMPFFYSIRGSLSMEQVLKFFPQAVEVALKDQRIKEIPSFESFPLYESNRL